MNYRFKRISFSYLAASFLLVLTLPAYALASTYQVNAVVPQPVPAIASQFDSNFLSLSTAEDHMVLSGTCTPISPYAIVSVWRSGVMIGSTTCTGGGYFSVDVSLIEGTNQLLPRTSNIDSVYGPDGTIAAITYSKATPTPSTSVPPTSNTTPQASPTPVLNPENQLVVSSAAPVVVPTESNEASVVIVIDGGSSPYEITINWGDGTVEIKKVENKGSYTFTHTYIQQKAYVLKATVKDVLGEVTEVSVPVVSNTTPPSPTVTPTPTGLHAGASNNGFRWQWLWWPIVLFIILSSYLLGRRRERRIWIAKKRRKKERKK